MKKLGFKSSFSLTIFYNHFNNFDLNPDPVACPPHHTPGSEQKTILIKVKIKINKMVIITLFILKFVVTILFVLLLSLLAEHVSPKVSGIISGIPTGTAIILFFYGLEQGPNFAIESSIFSLVGMFSMQIFIFLYLKVSDKNTKFNIFLSSFIATIGYLIVILVLKQFQFNILTVFFVPLISIPLFLYLFRNVNESKIKNAVKLGPTVLTLRAVIATLVILAITSTANLVGPAWAGLLSAFPTTLYPLILIIHSTYGKEHVHTIIKNVPKGQWSMILYIVGIFFTYPSFGIYIGTIISYSLVITYLLLLFIINKMNNHIK